MPISICIVDDHSIVVEGMAAMAAREPDIDLFGVATGSDELVQLLGRGERPDVILMDVRIGKEDGLALCSRVLMEWAGLRIAMFSAFGDPELVRASVAAGAVGYILKDVSTRQIPEIVRQIHETGSYFDPRIASLLLLRALEGTGYETRPTGRRSENRDLDILQAIAAGQTNQEIATALSLSPHTVKFHVGGLMRKFDVRRRTELVRVASERGLLR